MEDRPGVPVPGGLPRDASEGGGFARGITADETSAIGRRLGGVAAPTGDVSTAPADAARREGFRNRGATLARDIAGGPKPNDADTRTAQAVAGGLVGRSGVTTGIGPDQMREAITGVARGGL